MTISKKAVAAAKELIEKYRAIKAEDFDMTLSFSKYFDEHLLERNLENFTGFGTVSNCLICNSIKGSCVDCIYPDIHFRNRIRCTETPTYVSLRTEPSTDTVVWLKLIADRANALEERVKRIESGDLNEYLEK